MIVAGRVEGGPHSPIHDYYAGLLRSLPRMERAKAPLIQFEHWRKCGASGTPRASGIAISWKALLLLSRAGR
jgi:hypothetical protein